MSTESVAVHNQNAPLFAERYRLFSSNPHYNAFLYGRKCLFNWLWPFLGKRLPRGAKILEVGSGTGFLLALLQEKGYQVVGLEPAERMREIARLNSNGQIPIVAGTVTAIPFEANSFDAVIAMEVFRYLPDEEIIAGYRECWRALRPGGHLIVTLVNFWALDGFYLYQKVSQLSAYLLRRPAPVYCNFVTPGSITTLFEKQFGTQNVTCYGTMLPFLRPVYMLSRQLGEFLARRTERLDQLFSGRQWFNPVASHLVVVIKK